MALPSVYDLVVADRAQQPLSAKIGVVVILFYVPRLFYDCLVYWMGVAQPIPDPYSVVPNTKSINNAPMSLFHSMFPFSTNTELLVGPL